MFNISKFRAEAGANHGFVQTNKFVFQCAVPKGLTGTQNAVGAAKLMEFTGETVGFPGMSLATYDVRRYGYGPAEKRAYVPVFTDIQLQFYADGKATMWKFFQDWLRLIINSRAQDGIDILPGQTTGVQTLNGIQINPYELTYRDDYVTECQIDIYRNTGHHVKSLRLRDAYPTAMADIPLDWNDVNSFMKIPVTLTFIDHYETTEARTVRT